MASRSRDPTTPSPRALRTVDVRSSVMVDFPIVISLGSTVPRLVADTGQSVARAQTFEDVVEACTSLLQLHRNCRIGQRLVDSDHNSLVVIPIAGKALIDRRPDTLFRGVRGCLPARRAGHANVAGWLPRLQSAPPCVPFGMDPLAGGFAMIIWPSRNDGFKGLVGRKGLAEAARNLCQFVAL